jgi:hypothetical protein
MSEQNEFYNDKISIETLFSEMGMASIEKELLTLNFFPSFLGVSVRF